MGFYKRLQAMARTKGVGVYFYSPGGAQEATEYLASHGVHGIRSAPLRIPREIRGTPAAIMLDATDRVVADWMGRLSEPQELQLVELLTRL